LTNGESRPTTDADSRSAASQGSEAGGASSAAAEVGGSRGGKGGGRGKRGLVAPPPMAKRRKDSTSVSKAPPVSPGVEPSEQPAGSTSAAAEPALLPSTEQLPPLPRSPTGKLGDDESSMAASSAEVQRLNRDLGQLRDQLAAQKRKLHCLSQDRLATRRELCNRLIQAAKTQEAEERDQVVQEKCQLGFYRGMGPAVGSAGGWQGGATEEEIQTTQERIKADRSAIKRLRGQLNTRGKKSKRCGHGWRRGSRRRGRRR